MTAGFETLTYSIEQMKNSITDKLDEIRNLVKNPLQTASIELYNRSISRIKNQFYKDALDDLNSSIKKCNQLSGLGIKRKVVPFWSK